MKEPPVDRSVEIVQKDRAFVPNVLVVQKGTRVAFPNADPFLHNVFSPSTTHPFDLGSYRQGDKAGAVRLFNPGVVEVLCNMHAKMRANVLVVPNRHHVKVSADGSFRLENVPVGSRQLVAWTPDARPVDRIRDADAGGRERDVRAAGRGGAAAEGQDGQAAAPRIARRSEDGIREQGVEHAFGGRVAGCRRWRPWPAPACSSASARPRTQPRGSRPPTSHAPSKTTSAG